MSGLANHSAVLRECLFTLLDRSMPWSLLTTVCILIQCVAVDRKRELSYSSIADEDTLEETDLQFSSTSRNVAEFKPSLCRASRSNNLRLNYFTSAPAVASEKPIRTVFDTSQNLRLTHHVSEVMAVATDVPAVSSASEVEHVISLTEKRSDAPRKCSNWYCLRGKHPFQVTSLLILYLIVGVIFSPLLLLVFMICCVSYFTPDID